MLGLEDLGAAHLKVGLLDLTDTSVRLLLGGPLHRGQATLLARHLIVVLGTSGAGPIEAGEA